MELRIYVDARGRRPFYDWLEDLDHPAATKVHRAVAQLAANNLSETKSVGAGVWERRIHWGPGYRIYFGRDGATVIILLGGGAKARQGSDIMAARARWDDYKRGK